MIEIVTEIEIKASKEVVWKILTDFGAYKAWNPFICNIEGYLGIAENLVVTIQSSEKRSTVFKPIIINVTENRSLRWVGNIMFDWIFKGEHYFELSTTQTGTHLLHGEKFTGLLAPLILRFFQKPTEIGFKRMNEQLVRRVSNVK